MFKKIIQTAFIFIAISAFSQTKDRLGVPGPLVFENTKGGSVSYLLTKSGIDPAKKFIIQEYASKLKTGEKIVITFQPNDEPQKIVEKKYEEIKGDKRSRDIDFVTVGDNKYVIRYWLQLDKKPSEQREVVVGMGKTDAHEGTYIIEYFGGGSTQHLNLEMLPEIEIHAAY